MTHPIHQAYGEALDRAMKLGEGYGEERFIGERCPEDATFADWVRAMRGPEAAIRITPGLPGGAA